MGKELLDVGGVANMLEMGVSTVWAQVKTTNRFPKPFKISTRKTRWVASEVKEYLESLIRARDLKYN